MRSIERMYEEDTPMNTLNAVTNVGPSSVGSSSLGSSRIRSSAPVRLTRRGRLIVVAVLMAIMVLAGILGGHGSSQAAGHGSVAATSRTLTVKPGDTLWSVAARIAPHSDPRLVVADIESRNHLVGGQVRAGEQLRVPRIG